MSGAPTIRDLCRRWRYVEAKLEADTIAAGDDEDKIAKLCEQVTAEQKAIEERLAELKPQGAEDAEALLRVVVDMFGEDGCYSHLAGRDYQLIRMALKALAWADSA